jgi:catechol 2,3-dioxygenase-like lactoylglutathione lyase family enzyme
MPLELGDRNLDWVRMEVRNVRWVGIRTDRYEAMVGFLRDVLGLRVNFEEPTTIEFTTSEGDEVQVMAPGDPYYEFFGEQANGPVPLFEVDNVHTARREFEAAGVEVVGATERDSCWEWIHVRAPDGNLYEFASRLSEA